MTCLELDQVQCLAWILLQWFIVRLETCGLLLEAC